MTFRLAIRNPCTRHVDTPYPSHLSDIYNFLFRLVECCIVYLYCLENITYCVVHDSLSNSSRKLTDTQSRLASDFNQLLSSLKSLFYAALELARSTTRPQIVGKRA